MTKEIFSAEKLQDRGYKEGDEVLLPVTIRSFNAAGEKGTVWLETIISKKSVFVSSDEIVFAEPVKLVDGNEYLVDGYVCKVVYYNLKFFAIRMKDSAFIEITDDTKIEKYE